ncbi:hypothetical protein LINGRAHAP2_LOCUS17268 [Linum grandiflorum]
MVSTQLVESCNGIIRGVLSADKTIIDFFPHFDRMVESTRRAEKESEYHSRHSKPRNNFEYSGLVNKATSEYTPKMFAFFQGQFSRIQLYHLELVPEHKSEREPVYLLYTHDGNAGLDDRLVQEALKFYEVVKPPNETPEPVPNSQEEAAGDRVVGTGGGIATKFPKKPKPSKNSKRQKATSEISRMRQRTRYRNLRVKEAATKESAKARGREQDLAQIFNKDAIHAFTAFVQSQERNNIATIAI